MRGFPGSDRDPPGSAGSEIAELLATHPLAPGVSTPRVPGDATGRRVPVIALLEPFGIAIHLVTREILLHLLDVRLGHGTALRELVRTMLTGVREPLARLPLGDPINGALRRSGDILGRLVSTHGDIVPVHRRAVTGYLAQAPRR